MKSSNATTTVYSKAASLLWLQGSKELPAAARVRGLNSAARAGLGNFQEKKPEADHADQPRFFQKVGGGAYIYRLGERRWCLGPELHGEEVIWAETSFSGDRLPNSKDHSWRSNFGKPEISITRCGCFIHQGVGLRAADLDDNSNPYVVCKVSGRQKLGFRTQTRFKSLDPVWHETQDLEGLELGETMHFKVMSQEEHKDDEFLGDAKLVVSPGGFNGGLVLMLRGGVQSLMQLFFEGTAYCKEESMGALLNVASIEKVREELVAGGVVSWLLAMLQSTSPKSLSAAIRLLGCLAADQDVAEMVMDAALPRLRQLLQDSDENAKWRMLMNFEATKCPSDVVPAVDGEGLLQQGKFDCKAEAANAIGELANATDRRLFKKIAMHLLESDILEPLLALWLRSSGGSCSSHASRTLCVLASTEKTGTVILAKGALKPLVSLLKGHPQLARVLRVAKVLQALADFNRGSMDLALSQESSQQLMSPSCSGTTPAFHRPTLNII
ncbi:unnamed protein product [Durusdinium trenchii]|uniref:C2 domain-containing protein n=1 Tax=Durusdinium trenchii TaxID=1381693 RepID=A0ABP0T066_9DINO